MVSERTFRQLTPHYGAHLKMHNLMIPNFQLHRAEPVRPPELLNLFDDCIAHFPITKTPNRAVSIPIYRNGYRPTGVDPRRCANRSCYLGTFSPIQAQRAAAAPDQYRRIPRGAATKQTEHQTAHQGSAGNRYL